MTALSLFATVLTLVALSVAAPAAAVTTSLAATAGSTVTFSYTGAEQRWVVPGGVSSLDVDVQGGQGGQNTSDAGLGGRAQATLQVSPGETLYIYVGEKGHPAVGTGIAVAGGFNGGGDSGGPTGNGGGGGASDIRQGGATLANRTVVAGGGGGEGGGPYSPRPSGGAGGALVGATGRSGLYGGGGPGGGGSQSGGGAGGTGSDAGQPGQAGTGGRGGNGLYGGPGGGGGGGYYGGGGGGGSDGFFGQTGGGGGGGSNYTAPSASNVVHTQGYRPGHGQVVLVMGGSSGPIGGPVTPAETLGGAENIAERHLACSTGQATRDPVTTSTGNFWHTFDDLSIPGRGAPLNLSRTYNSSEAPIDGPLGYGWNYSYGVRLTVDQASGAVTVHQENGATATFTQSGSNYIAPPRVLATLAKNADGTYTLTRGGREVLTFNASGQLRSEKDLNGYTTTLAYGYGFLMRVTDPAGRALTVTNGGNLKIASVTDPGGRKVSYGYDGANNLITVTDVAGGITRFTYDDAHRLLTMTDPRGGVVTNRYDGNGRVDLQSDELGRATSFDYGSVPGSTKVTDPAGRAVLDTYQDGLMVSRTKAYGTGQSATWKRTYDAATLGCTSISDPNGHTKSMTYDGAGNLLTSVDALGRKTTATYNGLNEMTSVTDPAMVTTTMAYNAAGNLLSRSRPLVGTAQTQRTTYTYGDATQPGDVTSLTDPDGKVSTISYNSRGDVVSARDPLGNTTTYAYDILGRRTSMVSPKGSLSPAQYTTSFAYNPFGDLTATTDPLSHTSSRTYDANRNLASETDADGKVTTYTYDAADQRTVIRRPDGSTLRDDYLPDGALYGQYDGTGRATTYTYNVYGQVYSVTDPADRTTTYGHDAVGNLILRQDPGGDCYRTGVGCVRYVHDAADQLTAINYRPGTPNVTMAYDVTGRRTSMTDGSGTSRYTYDSLDRLTSSTNGAGQTTGHNYDLRGNATGITYPNGRTVTRGFDDDGRMTSVSDWLGSTTTFGYDQNSNPTTQFYPNTTRATTTYDAADRLTDITHTIGGTSLASFAYGRDNAGQLTSTTPTGVPQPNETYTYNALNQLSTVNAGTYSYDAADNLTRLASGATQAYDLANQLTSVTAATGTTAFGYDARGNRTTMTPPSQPTVPYAYDGENRLTKAGANATYTYNGDGLRMTKTLGTTQSGYSWDLSNTLPLLLTDGVINYIYGPTGKPIERIDEAANILYYHQDQLGSTRLLSTSGGTVAGTYTYDAYGKPTASTGTVSQPFGYAGEYTDSETGFQYLRARYYDPETAQFLTRDPITALTRSPYGYVEGNPLNAVDPSGEALCLGPIHLGNCSGKQPPANWAPTLKVSQGDPSGPIKYYVKPGGSPTGGSGVLEWNLFHSGGEVLAPQTINFWGKSANTRSGAVSCAAGYWWVEATQTQDGRTEHFTSNEVYTECQHPGLESAPRPQGGLGFCAQGDEDTRRRGVLAPSIGFL